MTIAFQHSREDVLQLHGTVHWCTVQQPWWQPSVQPKVIISIHPFSTSPITPALYPNFTRGKWEHQHYIIPNLTLWQTWDISGPDTGLVAKRRLIHCPWLLLNIYDMQCSTSVHAREIERAKKSVDYMAIKYNNSATDNLSHDWTRPLMK